MSKNLIHAIQNFLDSPKFQSKLKISWVRELLIPILMTILVGWLFIKTRNQIAQWSWTIQFLVWPAITFIVLALYRLIGVPNFKKMYRDPRQLGWIRICVGLGLLVLAFKDDVLTSLILPVEYAYYWHGPIAKLYQKFPEVFAYRNESFLTFISWGTRISLVLATLGLFTRFSLILSFLFYLNFYFIQIVYTHFYSSGYLTLLLLGFLCFVPCRALSLDQILFKTDDHKKDLDFTPIIFTCFAAYGLSYFVCGLSKWNLEHYWAASNNMKKYIAGDAAALIDQTFGLDLIPDYVQMGGPDLLFFLLGTSVLIFETGALVVLFSNWGRLVIPPLLICFHLGTQFLQKFIFPELVFAALMFLPISLFLGPLKENKNSPKSKKKLSLPILLLCCFFISHIISGWMTNHKVYPWSNTWNMYAHSGYAESTWYNFYYLNLKSGKKIKTDLTETIDFLGQAKWHSISYWPRDSKEKEKLKKLLNRYTSAYNGSPENNDKILSIDFVHWTWNFVNDAQNEHHGVPEKLLRYDVEEQELKSLPISEF